jgi:hypothetical protein
MENIIRERLAQYLDARITLREFQAWFVPATWNLEATADPAAFNLATEIELRLAEFTNGHITESQLRDIFLSIATTYTVTVELDFHVRVRAVLESASRTIRLPQPGTPLVVVLA